MLRNVSISLSPSYYITDRKIARSITITVQYEGKPDFQRNEIIEESDFQSNFGIVIERIKKEFLKEYKKERKVKEIM